jgi:hypothetical protein
MRGALYLTKFANFGGAIRRGSKPVSGGVGCQRQLQDPPTHTTTTGDPHVSRVSARPSAWQLGQKPLAARRGVLAILPAEAVLVSRIPIGHQGSQY